MEIRRCVFSANPQATRFLLAHGDEDGAEGQEAGQGETVARASILV